MKTVGMYEAKTHLPKIVAEVQKGETFTITKHGHPVALIQPADPGPRKDVTKVIEDLRKFRRKVNIKGLSRKEIRDFIEEGRR